MIFLTLISWNNQKRLQIKLKMQSKRSIRKKLADQIKLIFTLFKRRTKKFSNYLIFFYTHLIDQRYHPWIWRIGYAAIIKKIIKLNYVIPKSYWLIALLNCLRKIAEKIVANRLSYWVQKSDLLNENQMSGRKNWSVIDTVMNLTYDIQHAF